MSPRNPAVNAAWCCPPSTTMSITRATTGAAWISRSRASANAATACRISSSLHHRGGALQRGRGLLDQPPRVTGVDEPVADPARDLRGPDPLPTTVAVRKFCCTNSPRLAPIWSFFRGMIAVCGIGIPSGYRNSAVTANQSARPPTIAASAAACKEAPNALAVTDHAGHHEEHRRGDQQSRSEELHPAQCMQPLRGDVRGGSPPVQAPMAAASRCGAPASKARNSDGSMSSISPTTGPCGSREQIDAGVEQPLAAWYRGQRGPGRSRAPRRSVCAR